MRIVHLYPPLSTELAQYVSLLTELPHEKTEATDDVKTFLKECTEKRADIVHLHHCLNTEFINAVLTAQQQGARIVLTPHGKLESWEMNEQMKNPPGLRKMVTHAYCVIARSEIEAQELKMLGWNKRIVIIRNPILTQTTNKATCLEQHQHIYQQVMDSYVLEKMDQSTLHALRTFLKVGITEDERWKDELNTNAINWHYLLIYARQEGILPYIEQGCRLMNINIPEKTATPSFLPDTYEVPTQLGGFNVFEKVLNIHQQVTEGKLSLRSLAELDQALRKDEVEDDVVMQQMDTEKLTNFFAALLTVMNEQTGLDEGFMPCQPVENKETNRIRTTIQKHLQI